MEVSEIKQKKRHGDFSIVAAIVGKNPENVRQALNNAKSANHKAVVDAFTKIIEAREPLLNS